jgi:microcystin-dependent protein
MWRIRFVGVAVVALVALWSPQARAQNPFLGEVRTFAFNFCPAGWLEADGRLLAISGNEALFSLLGTTYGGDGQTMFALPDLRGRAVIAAGQGADLTPRALGETGGQEQVTLGPDQLPAHSHPLMATTGRAGSKSPAGAAIAMTKKKAYLSALPDVAMEPASIGSTGAGEPVPTVPPFLAMTVCIARLGIYPAQN